MIGMLAMGLLQTDVDRFRSNDVDTAGNPTGLDCSTPSGLSQGTRVTCLFGDLLIPAFIIGILAIAGGFIADKYISG
jgi:hypothetical protein